MDGTKIGSLAVALPASAYVGFSGGTGGSTDRHAISGLTVVGTGATEEPKPATLKITNAISAPSGSPQAETSLTYSGTCPSSFTTAALGNGGSATPDADRRRRGRELLGRRGGAERHRLEDHRLDQRRRARRTQRSGIGAHRAELRPRRGRQHRRVHEHLHRAQRRTAGGDAEDHRRDQRAERLPAGRNDAHLQRHLPLQLHDRRARQRRLRHADAHRRRPGRRLLGRRDRAHRHRLEDHRLGQRRRRRRNRRLRRQSHGPHLRPRSRRQHRRVHQHLHGAERRNRRSHDPRPERRRLAAQRQRTARKPEPRADEGDRQPGGQRLLADQGRPAQPRLRIHDLDRRRQRRRRARLRDRRRDHGPQRPNRSANRAAGSASRRSPAGRSRSTPTRTPPTPPTTSSASATVPAPPPARCTGSQPSTSQPRCAPARTR